MIILELSKTPNNSLACQFLTENEHEKKDSLVIIDLDEQDLIPTAKYYFQRLSRVRLLKIPSHMYLIKSDNLPKYNLTVLAHQLAQLINESRKEKTMVHVITDLNVDITNIQLDSKWTIYGANQKKESERKILWQGDHLLQWMDHPQRSFNGLSYTW